MLALRGCGIEESAGDLRVENIGCFLVNELMQAALTAAVTKRLPFTLGHLFERFLFPKMDHRCRLLPYLPTS
jgi:hypothetical protein